MLVNLFSLGGNVSNDQTGSAEANNQANVDGNYYQIGNIAGGTVTQDSNNSATGGSFNMDFKFEMPAMGLQNLVEYDYKNIKSFDRIPKKGDQKIDTEDLWLFTPGLDYKYNSLTVPANTYFMVDTSRGGSAQFGDPKNSKLAGLEDIVQKQYDYKRYDLAKGQDMRLRSYKVPTGSNLIINTRKGGSFTVGK